MFTMKSEVVYWPSVLTDDDLVQSIDQKKVIGEPWFPGLTSKTPWQAVESL
jgi:hypothetical protein